MTRLAEMKNLFNFIYRWTVKRFIQWFLRQDEMIRMVFIIFSGMAVFVGAFILFSLASLLQGALQ
jgi:hypothetical protein